MLFLWLWEVDAEFFGQEFHDMRAQHLSRSAVARRLSSLNENGIQSLIRVICASCVICENLYDPFPLPLCMPSPPI